jgi:hypothetical protein
MATKGLTGMPEDTDYKAVVEQLQKDLEQARLTIMSLRYVHSPLDRLNSDSIRRFVQQNYLVLILAIMLSEVIFKVVVALIRKDK